MAGVEPPARQIQVFLTLHDGEQSFGMSLAQKTSIRGATYTVVSSVFANSPADRAGVHKGDIVQRINDRPMDGLTVAQVANHFRNVGQARITLGVVESAVSTGGGGAMLSVKKGEQVRTTLTGVAGATSGRAIAAPGSALAGLQLAPLKQQLTPPAAALWGVQTQNGVHPFENMASPAAKCGHEGAVRPTTDPDRATGRLAAKPGQRELTAQNVAVVAITNDSVAKSVSGKPSNTFLAEECRTSSRRLKRFVEVIEAPSIVASVQVGKEHKEIVTAAQSKDVPAPTANATLSVAGKKSFSAPGSLSTKAMRAATKPTRDALLQPVSHPSSATKSSPAVLNSSLPSRVKTTSAKPPVFTVSETSVANSEKWPAKGLSSSFGTTSGESAMQVPAVCPPKPVVVTTMSPIEVVSRSKAGLAKSKTSTPVCSTTRITPVTSATIPPSPLTIPVRPTTTKTGKKRRRRRPTKATTGTTSKKGKGKTKKAAMQQQERDWADSSIDDEDVFDYCASSSDSDLEESPSKEATCRTAKVRRRGVTDRTRQSLTIVRLVDMGFKKEDAEASVKKIGDDLDACMVWIISKIEERQFYKDLNRASIQSERSKQDEEKRVNKLEKEKLARADKFIGIFPTSYMVCPESTASHLKKLLLSTIDQVHGDSYLREVLSELMKLEGKSIRWYKEASRSYMLELAGRLNAALGTHDVMTCCARASARDISSPNGCGFVRKMLEEIKALTTALFEMPTNQGGVPPVFLECDEATRFDLEDDGFEVVELKD